MRRTSRLVYIFAAILAVFLGVHLLTRSQLELEDALYLTKNTFKELQSQYMCKSRKYACPKRDQGPPGEERSSQIPTHNFLGMDLDLNSSFSNVVNSVFPIDLVVSYNASNSTHEFLARYASFSAILNGKIRSEYAIVPGHACSKIHAEDHPHLKDKILIVLRGKCTFVDKVSNILDSGLRPRAIAVANNEPYHSLITMYSSTFNEDGLVNVPILFITNEDYSRLKELEPQHIELQLQTASVDGWINLMLLMAVSPPLLILVCYLLIRAIQTCHRRRVSVLNQRLVRKLPVFIFNRNHLVPTSKFYGYLTATGQTQDIPLILSSSEDLPAGQEPEIPQNILSYVINGTDLYSLKDMHLLFANKDFYTTQKCSICLDRFIPLKSRVLVLECKHIYHEKCLSNWLINFRRSCPLCNEALHLFDGQPLLANDTSSYGSFGVDLERNSQYSDQGLSTTAVRSLQLDRLNSNPRENNAPSSTSNLGRSASMITGHSSQSISSITAQPSNVPSAQSVESEESFMTSRSHITDFESTFSQYITPQITNNGVASGDETELDESSSLTIRAL